MSQAGAPGAEKKTSPELRELVFGQATELSALQQELSKAFPSVQSQIAALEKTSESTVGSVTALSAQINTIAGALAGIQQSLDALRAQVSASGNPSPASVSAGSSNLPANPVLPAPQQPQPEPSLVSPRPFNGNFDQSKGFLAQCELLFTHQPSKYSSDGSKIALVMSLLVDDALSWAIAAVENNPVFTTDYSQFKSEFRAVFDHPADGQDASSRLLVIRQGSRSVAQYTLQFRILAAESRWNDQALLSVYRKGLNDSIKDLIVRDSPTSLSELISLALMMDTRLQERRTDKAQRVPSRSASGSPVSSSFTATSNPPLLMGPPSSTAVAGEPMEIDRSRLSREERELRMSNQLCLYCGESGHYIRACPSRPKGPARR